MALKFVVDTILDEALSYLSTNGTMLVLCEDQPADYTDATTDKGAGGHALGEDTSGTYTGPANGDTSGRKITVDAITGIAVDVTGIFDYIAIVDGVNNTLLLCTPLPYSAVTAVATATDTVTIDGDHTGDLAVDDDVTIRESTGNDGIYTVASATLSGGDTAVVVNENIADATVDGYMIYGAQKVTSGNTADVNAFDEEIVDAA